MFVCVKYNPPLCQGVDKQRTPYCVYWDEKNQIWSQTGLQITSCDSKGVSCASDHLTNFAVLMVCLFPFQDFLTVTKGIHEYDQFLKSKHGHAHFVPED